MDSSDFSFDGIHISDFGAVFLPSKWPGAAKITANEAAVPGRHGTIRYPGETYGEKALEGKLYLIDPDDELMTYDAGARRRGGRVAASGRTAAAGAGRYARPLLHGRDHGRVKRHDRRLGQRLHGPQIHASTIFLRGA